jgi:hypothetical protein
MNDTSIIGICSLCSSTVDPSDEDNWASCAASSGAHPPDEVYWYEMSRTPVAPPPNWRCASICGKGICRDLGACHKAHPEAAEDWHARGKERCERIISRCEEKLGRPLNDAERAKSPISLAFEILGESLT